MKEVKNVNLYEKAMNAMFVNLNGTIRKDRVLEMVKKYIAEENIVTVIAYLHGWIDEPVMPLYCGSNNELLNVNIFNNEVQYRTKYGPMTRYFNSESVANDAKNNPYPSKYAGSSTPRDENSIAVEFDNVYDESYTTIDEWIRQSSINDANKEVWL